MFIGVDGTKTGWVAVALSNENVIWVQPFDNFEALIEAIPDATYIAVDMPIGLLQGGQSANDNVRDADKAARKFLQGQASSVFNAPLRQVLDAGNDYKQASQISHEISGKRITKQTHALMDKINQVDKHINDKRIYEVHPEVSFRIMNGECNLPRKKSWQGFWVRLQLLREQEIELPEQFEGAETIPMDDVIDAAAAAWSARRIARNQARRFPESSEQQDRSGRVIAIWA